MMNSIFKIHFNMANMGVVFSHHFSPFKFFSIQIHHYVK